MKKKSIQGYIGKFLEKFRKFKVIKGNLGMTNKFSEFIQFFVKKGKENFLCGEELILFFFIYLHHPSPVLGRFVFI